MIKKSIVESMIFVWINGRVYLVLKFCRYIGVSGN
jgi:hypothetical protein